MTYGQCDYEQGRFRIALQPHACMRFKALFPSVPKGAASPYWLCDKPDLATDLDWFFKRYPVRLSASARDRLAESVTRYHADRREAESILQRHFLPGSATGFREDRQPYGYQQRAAELARLTGHLLLLDDVGLGKTVSALAMIADGRYAPAIVVVPPHVSGQWIEEYIRVFTRLAACEVTTTTPEPLPPADIYVFRYSQLAGWADHFREIAPRAVIFDEIQDLRHGVDTAKGRGAAALAMCDSVELRVGLTATPVYNYGSEIFNIFEFIAPGALGSHGEFLTEWCSNHGQHWVVREPDVLGEYLRDQMLALRRTEHDEEVGKALPPLNRLLIDVEWDAGDVEDQEALMRSLAVKVLEGSFTERGQAARELDMMMRLRTGVAKARAVAAYVRMLVQAGEPVLVAGWHRDVYDIWQRELADLEPVFYTGSESARQKSENKRAFIEGRAKVMFMSLRSGAGTDGLQDVCANIVIGELDWSPQVHKQIIGRLRRPGQKRQVTAHFLHTDRGSDPVIMEILGLKASQSQGILDPFQEASAQDADDGRMRRLAQSLLADLPQPEEVE